MKLGRGSKGWLVLAWLATVNSGATGETAPMTNEITLDDAVSYALKRNPELVAVRLGIEQARARLAQAGRLGPPELSSEFKPNVAGREGTLSVGFSQRFPALGRLRAERAVSRAGLAEAEAEVRDAERRVRLQVRLVGVEGLALASQLALKDRQVANSRELAETARRVAERGEGTVTEAAQWDLEARQLELDRRQLEASQAESRAELRSWLGWPEGQDLRLVGELPDPREPTREPWDPVRRPDFRAAKARSEAAQQGISLARASRWEEIGVGVFGEVDRREDAPIGLENESMVGVGFSVPLPIWGRFRGRIDEAAVTASRAEREAEALVVRARTEVEIARVRLEAAARRAEEILTQLLPRSAALEENLRTLHTQGQATLTDVLRARERRLGLESSAIAARRDFHVALVRFQAAMGDAGDASNDASRPDPGTIESRRAPERQRRRRRGTRSRGDDRDSRNVRCLGTRRPRARRGFGGWRVLAALLVVFASPLVPAATSTAEGRSKEPPVVLDASTIQNLRLSTETVSRRVFEQTVFALGRIRVAPGHQAFVSSRIAGRATRVEAHIDSRVERGAALVVMESRVAGEPPPTVTLTAPMSGLIAAVNVALGQPISPEASLIEIVALEEVHAVAAVPEHWVGLLKLGNRARLRVSALPGRDFEAELAHFAAEADATSGTLDAAFHVENADYALRPGMRAEFSIVVDSRPGVLAISREAVQGDLGKRSVFVRDAARTNAFLRVPVVLGAENDRYVEVLRGLEEGDEVVARGAYSLAFAGGGATSLRAAMDAAHGHAHNEDGSEVRETERDAAKSETDPEHAAEEDSDHDHDHDHAHGDEAGKATEDDHDHDHDHERDRPGAPRVSGAPGIWGERAGVWATFFAATTALLLVLLVTNARRERGRGAGAEAGGSAEEDAATSKEGGPHA